MIAQYFMKTVYLKGDRITTYINADDRYFDCNKANIILHNKYDHITSMLEIKLKR